MIKNNFHSHSKKVWFINGLSFTSDKGTKNGKQKAVEYCRKNLLDEKEIIPFDSEMECKRYKYLLTLEKEGKISDLKHHFIFPLIEEFENQNGVVHSALTYEADFYYHDIENDCYRVEDVKGYIEDVFDIKWKLFDMKYACINLAIECLKLASGRDIDYLKPENWIVFDKMKKSTKRIDKLKSQYKDLKKQVNDKAKEERKRAKELARIEELKSKQKLTKQEKERLNELISKYS